MRESCREVKKYCDGALLVFKEPMHRAELETVFYGINDTKLSRTWYGKRRKDSAFQNMRAAVADYLQNGGEDRAKKAYGECRNYLAKWLQQDGRLKGGSTTENTRNQGVVRMLELMEKMPDFQNCIYQKSAKKTAPDDWVLVGENDLRYNKLNFKTLVRSLEEHALEAKDEDIHAGKRESSKSFTNLNQRIERKQARERAAQEKAEAKAAKAAKKAKSGKTK